MVNTETSLPDRRLVSLRGLARELRLPFPWLKAESNAGRLPCLRAGRKRRFNTDAVIEVLSERAAQGKA